MSGLDAAHLLSRAAAPGRQTLAGLPVGHDVAVLAALARAAKAGQDILVLVRDDVRLAALSDGLAVVAPEVPVLPFPAWDCLPYDRAGPHPEIVASRLDTLARLARPAGDGPARLVIATVNAALQRVPRRDLMATLGQVLKVGDTVAVDDLLARLTDAGYLRTDQVMEPGEVAVRGGLIDLFPPGAESPVRLDLFGDEIESIRRFDAVSQRTSGKLTEIHLGPSSEVMLDKAAISRFRSAYRELFGGALAGDPLYEALSEGARPPGLEHWLPLFHDGLDTLFDYVPPERPVILDHQAEEVRDSRLEQIAEYHQARLDALAQKLDPERPYRPVPPDRLFLDAAEWNRVLATRPVLIASPFGATDLGDAALDAGGRPGRDFADIRARPDDNLFEAVLDHLKRLGRDGYAVVLTAASKPGRHRLATLLADHGAEAAPKVDDWPAALVAAEDGAWPVVVAPFARGFVAHGLAVITEQDILGDRLARQPRRKRQAERFIADVSTLSEGDLVVHVDHGIGCYEGLETVRAGGAPHDCLRLRYDGGDKLFVPVENIETLSRYGSEQAGAQLDKLGGVAWQARKARLKQRIREMADELIRIAAARHLRPGQRLSPPEGLYEEFAARFPFEETDDQLKAISDTLSDMASGQPMDRLICGDVGFGKTEVALRAAFVAAFSGAQVAVVVPTTLLARQHFRTFQERFAGLPVRVAQVSRMVGAREVKKVKEGLAEGTIDIVIGTHALLADSVRFKRLGLVVVDEEQHFGVAHKERLKRLKADLHVLTLTATPIPRTLQMALTGVRELSIIATPPVDRLAVRTFISPFDPVVVREAILRERNRSGQTFVVCPRVADIPKVAERLEKLIPEVRLAIAHGQLTPSRLETVMAAFTEGEADVLLATNIIESGLDMPGVNTILVYRADMFGLAQLYQLRGRVGRGKARGYAYLTVPPDRKLSGTAERRLQVMQTLDSLGAGFSLASHDLDIRGAGNLLGDEQSGHIKEVGIELYQHLLEEAVAAARRGEGMEVEEETFSPQIGLGAPVLIPETYVPDLSLRLSLYRRLADLTEEAEIEDLAGELEDRFGPRPPEVDNLLAVVGLKALCRKANVEKVEAGPKGAVLTFRERRFPNPAGLVAYISQQAGSVKVRPDHSLVVMRLWESPADRLAGARRVLETLARVAAEG
ncbi:transcription-repair coupling factor [Roseospirillum parvum]|uniref:Transcription-repair-coupling factor n=1 Tax=Roseospirillum parvum TaxID=83401 RepID=A0A1G7XWA2_9PROT|nr:transcription-repair coupling factor [Roseospirillum parvum]SDG88459.1 transcription-repair coupling factor (superfamily II helicase) [Roseospirillum parvum]